MAIQGSIMLECAHSRHCLQEFAIYVQTIMGDTWGHAMSVVVNLYKVGYPRGCDWEFIMTSKTHFYIYNRLAANRDTIICWHEFTVARVKNRYQDFSKIAKQTWSQNLLRGIDRSQLEAEVCASGCR